METIRNYIEALFATLPQNADTQRIKADMLSNLEEKYHTLLEEGKNEAEATGIVIASIGSADELRETFGFADEPAPAEPDAVPHAESAQPDPAVVQEYGRYQTRKHIMIATAVALFILSPFTRSFFDDTLHLKTLGTFVMFAIIATGVALCILSGRKDGYYRELYGLGRHGDKDADDDRKHPISSLFASIAFPVAAAVYVCIGIFYGLWHPGWVIFLFCSAVTAAIAAYEEYRRRN